MIKNNVLIINYMEKMNELYNDELLTVEVESDNYNLEYQKKFNDMILNLINNNKNGK